MMLELGAVEALELIAGTGCTNFHADHGYCFAADRTTRGSREPTAIARRDPVNKPTEPPTFTCDWGHCDDEAVDSRWAHDLGEWLAVCAHHVTGMPNRRWRRSTEMR